MVVAIINHNYNENVKEAKEGFRPFSDVYSVDSGSELTKVQRTYFDQTLPNVYYSGLINAVFDKFKEELDDFVIYFISSDVKFSNYQKAIERVKEAFDDLNVGVYAPCANASSHKQMVAGNGKDLREVVFVEGFCFAVRLGILRHMCPVDVSVNQIGWGLDVYLGYLAIKNGQKSVVDYQIEVYHPLASGYDSSTAKVQRDRWFEQREKKAQFFRRWATFQPLNSSLGLWWLKSRIQ